MTEQAQGIEGRRPLRVLVVEDVPIDADLELRELARAGIACESLVVSSREGLIRGLDDYAPDLVLCDYTLPQLDGLEALEIRGALAPDLPFLIVTASIDERTAVACLKAGADDYVTKDRLVALPHAVLGALEKKRLEQVERQALERQRLAAAVFECTNEAVLIADTGLKILAANRAFAAITGWSVEEILGRHARFLGADPGDQGVYESLARTLAESGHWHGEISNRRKDGEVYPVLLNVAEVRNERGERTHFVGVFADIAALKQSQDRLAHLAHHDPLTDLPNRLALEPRLEHAIGQARREGHMTAVLFMDLDGFKQINDSLGHAMGDRLLRVAAERLGGGLRQEDLLARFGGDEFVLLIEILHRPEAAGAVAERLLAALAEPLPVDGERLQLSASIGIGIYPRDGDSAEALLRNADTAMYRSKERGRGGYCFYDRVFTERVRERMELESGLRLALERGELRVHYQPSVGLADGRAAGAEALVRWQHPTLGLVLPDRFVPVAVDSSLIVPIGEWILRQACAQARAWQSAGLPVERISVNIAGPQVLRSDLARMVVRVLDETGLPPECLELEVTEGFIMSEADESIQTLESLRRLGVRLSIDDFGTGYSSLSYLKRLPVDRLKIDRSFVKDLPGDANDLAISRAILALAKSLGLAVTAEGVETEEQASLLAAEGCGEAQGYFYSRPLEPGAFADWMRARVA
jgi:diguanylate cyclase (GGDEF)-like protein